MSWYREHKRCQVDCGGPEKSLSKQEFKDECDINIIMKKYGPREMVPLGGTRQPMFGDFTQVVDYASAMEQTQDAYEQFMELPAELRAMHDNDPQRFIDWFDAADEEALRNAGLIVEPPPAAVVVSEAPRSGAEAPAEPAGGDPGTSAT